MSEKDDKKLFGKYHDLILLIIGILLTSLIGTWITNRYQLRQWEKEAQFQTMEWNRQNKALLRQSQVEQAKELFSNVSKRIDKVELTAQMFVVGAWFANEKFTKNEYQKRHEELRMAIRELITKNNYYRNLLELYFGEEVADYFEDEMERVVDIWNLFELNDTEEEFYELTVTDLEMFWKNDSNFPYNILYIKMIEAIKDQNIGSFRKEEHLPNELDETE